MIARWSGLFLLGLLVFAATVGRADVVVHFERVADEVRKEFHEYPVEWADLLPQCFGGLRSESNGKKVSCDVSVQMFRDKRQGPHKTHGDFRDYRLHPERVSVYFEGSTMTFTSQIIRYLGELPILRLSWVRTVDDKKLEITSANAVRHGYEYLAEEFPFLRIYREHLMLYRSEIPSPNKR